jgi:hypothetical protein
MLLQQNRGINEGVRSMLPGLLGVILGIVQPVVFVFGSVAKVRDLAIVLDSNHISRLRALVIRIWCRVGVGHVSAPG